MKLRIGSSTTSTRVRVLLAAVLALASAFGVVSHAAAQTTFPTTVNLNPPEGNTPFLIGHARGTQGYVCLPTSAGASTASWTVNGARPEATLFTTFFGKDVQIITHFLSPDTHPNAILPNPPFGNATWQSSFDSSRVWAQVFKASPSGTVEDDCPNSGSIACLLLQSVGNDVGPAGGKLLANVSFVQRLNTKGGLAPSTGCATSTDVGKQALVPYSADYIFFHGAE
jgi:Protein of unknown function (DUF3455)